jgi:hypothetical protein
MEEAIRSLGSDITLPPLILTPVIADKQHHPDLPFPNFASTQQLVGNTSGLMVKCSRQDRRATSSHQRRSRGGEWIVGDAEELEEPPDDAVGGVARGRPLCAPRHPPRRDDPTAPVFPNRSNGGSRTDRPMNWDSPARRALLYENLLKPVLATVRLPASVPARHRGRPRAPGRSRRPVTRPSSG